MLAWLWDAFFGEEAAESDDTVGVSVADLSTVTQDMRALQSTVSSAKESLAATEKNARLFYQSIEALLIETYDATSPNAHVSPDSDELRAMRADLEEQRSLVMMAMLKQKDAIELRLFRAQMQLRMLEKQKQNIEASARDLDNAALQPGHVAFPAPVTPEFSTSGGGSA